MTVPILRTSERRAFKRCQARWWWSYREGLKPKGAESTPLWFGTGVHLAFAEWYIPGIKRGIHPAETWEIYSKDALHRVKVSDATEERVAEYEDGVKLGAVLMDEYVKKYGNDSQWRFIAPEQTFSLDIPWPKDRQTIFEVDEETGLLVNYSGTFDGVYEDLNTNRIELLETKTAKAVSTGHLDKDDQAGSYWAVASYVLRKQGLIRPEQFISGINYNFVRKAMPDDRPRDARGYACNKPKKDDYIAALVGVDGWTELDLRKTKVDDLESIAVANFIEVLGERSKVQPGPLFERHMIHRTAPERQTQLRRIQDEAVQMELLRQGMVAPTKNPTRDCTWDCEFSSMCGLQEQQGDWQSHRDVFFKIQDPYADHRKSSDE